MYTTFHFSLLGEKNTVAILRESWLRKSPILNGYQKSATNLIHVPQIFIS